MSTPGPFPRALRTADETGKLAGSITWTKVPVDGSKLTHPRVCCLRSNETAWDAETLWHTYTRLTDLEAVFRGLKSELGLRPVFHHTEDRTAGHLFLCMLAYYLEWHMRRCLAPMLFDDTDKDEAEALRSSVVAQAQRSKAAVKKQTTGVTPDGLPVHSFRTLLADLATLARNTIVTAINPLYPLTVVTRPTPVQQKAFDLLGVAV